MRAGGRRGAAAGVACACSLLLPALLAAAPAPTRLQVAVDRAGDGRISIAAEALVAAPPGVLWGALTDYGNLARFVPDLRRSRVASAPGEPLVVEQEGVARFLLFRFPIRVSLAIDSERDSVIRFRRTAGNLRELTGTYRVEAEGAATRLRYEARLLPDFWVPSWIGPGVLQRAVSRQLQGIIDEALRRAANDRAASPGG